MQTTVQTSPTLLVPKKMSEKGFVVLGVDEYEELKKSAVPTYYLTGKAAEEADKLVEEGIREHKDGKTRRIDSLTDLR